MSKFYKWKNTVKVKLNPVVYQGGGVLQNWLGYCLAVAQTILGASWSGATAADGWDLVKGKHKDKKVPTGVYVPLWFSGYYKMGHVLIAKFNKDGKSGTAWTSPNDPKAKVDILKFSNIDNLVAQLKSGWSSDTKYLGWSEYMGTTRVIKKVAYKKSYTALSDVVVRSAPDTKAKPSGSKVTKKGKKFGAVEVVPGASYIGHDGKKHHKWLKSSYGNYTAKYWYK